MYGHVVPLAPGDRDARVVVVDLRGAERDLVRVRVRARARVRVRVRVRLILALTLIPAPSLTLS